MANTAVVPAELIEKRILLVGGQRVLLDTHLAELCGVETKALKSALRRNLESFPSDFMFELTRQEYSSLRYQFRTYHSRMQRARLFSRPRMFSDRLHARPRMPPRQGHLPGVILLRDAQHNDQSRGDVQLNVPTLVIVIAANLHIACTLHTFVRLLSAI
jgi:hypothetical protein